MRRSAALLIGLALVVPLAIQPSVVGAAVGAAKLSPAMRQLLADGGYRDPAAIAKLVPTVRVGEVYYLARVRGRLDRALFRSLTRAGARVTTSFPEISHVALASPARAITRVAALDRVVRLEIDRIQRVLGVSVEYLAAAQAKGWGDQNKRGTADVGADRLWAAGVDGTGVTVGVADTGLDTTHPDLDDLDWRNWGGDHPDKSTFIDCQLSIPSLLTEVEDPHICEELPIGHDLNGHGTHVAGIATGTAQGGGADQQGLFPGMAPGAMLAAANVFPAGAPSTLSSQVMAGMRALALEKTEGGAGADVVNMSLGGSRSYGPPFGAELETNSAPQDQLLNALAQKYNVLFVVAAGNSGPVLGSVSNPSAASQALSVGASVADFDRDHPVSETVHGEMGDVAPHAARNRAPAIAAFSGRGPSGDRLVKPDVLAPGVYVIAPESRDGADIAAFDRAHTHKLSEDPFYAVVSGTSMASPSAAGVAALVASGYKKVYGNIPAYYRLKAALANTAGTKAYEGSVIGQIFGTLVANDLAEREEFYPVRNSGVVGNTGTGAGRVNAPAALFALTKGVIAYTPQRGALDDIHELQPSWAMDDIAPGGSARTTFVLRGAQRMQRSARVTFKMVSGGEPPGVNAAPASWFSLPGSVTARSGRDVPARFAVRVPSAAKPGVYTAAIVGTVELGSMRQTIRIPVQFFVRMTEPNLKGGSSIEGPIWAAEATDYSLVGGLNPLADVSTDWTMIPLYLPKGTQRVDFSVYDVAGRDQMDLFVFDENGEELASTVFDNFDRWVPGNALSPFVPTDKEFPAETSLDTSQTEPSCTPDCEAPVRFESTVIALPTTVWMAVSNTAPASAPSMSRFHLDVDVVGAASTGIGGVAEPKPKPEPRADVRPLPATGVASAQGLAVALIAAAAAAIAWLRPRRRITA